MSCGYIVMHVNIKYSQCVAEAFKFYLLKSQIRISEHLKYIHKVKTFFFKITSSYVKYKRGDNLVNTNFKVMEHVIRSYHDNEQVCEVLKLQQKQFFTYEKSKAKEGEKLELKALSNCNILKQKSQEIEVLQHRECEYINQPVASVDFL